MNNENRAKELELEAVREKTKRSIQMEELRHKNTMEELEYMAKHNIIQYNSYFNKDTANKE
jgi:hypothetical protein